jgi:chemosensory pili system protein ChpA (sensor histidine kinase/response regulator)
MAPPTAAVAKVSNADEELIVVFVAEADKYLATITDEALGAADLSLPSAIAEEAWPKAVAPVTQGVLESRLNPEGGPGLKLGPPVEPLPEFAPAAQQAQPVAQAAANIAPIAEAAPTEPPGDATLTAIFLEDAWDLLDRMDERLRDWQLAPERREPLDAIQRLLHTLKGSARLSGLSAIGDLSHALESTLTAIARGDLEVSDDLIALARRSLDTLSSQVDALNQGARVPAADDLVVSLSQTRVAVPAMSAVARPAPAYKPIAPASGAPDPQAGRGPGDAVAQIRVQADLLSQLIDRSGALSTYHARLAQHNGALGSGLAALDTIMARLREQLRQLDIQTEAQLLDHSDRDTADAAPTLRGLNPLALKRFWTVRQISRSITETVNDLASVKNLLANIGLESADLLVQQGRIADDLHDGLLRTCMVPFVQMAPRLHRTVRQTAQALKRRATLVVRGAEVELDRGILDRIGPPLEHLLRNAVAHGIERPDGRLAAGKPAEGVIELVLSREGNDVIISLSDDGAGMNLDAIRRRADERGLLQGADVTDEELLQLAMEPGFTTVDNVTQIAGRGIGLDVVATEVRCLSGSLALNSRAGQGTVFTIRLPLTLATSVPRVIGLPSGSIA